MTIYYIGGHVYHKECVRQYVNTARRPNNRLCPSCRRLFDHTIPLFFDFNQKPIEEEYDDSLNISLMKNSEESDCTQQNILPDISFYQESMESLQQSNDVLSIKCQDLERTIIAYQRRIEAQEEARQELERQVAELGHWLERVRRMNSEQELESSRLKQIISQQKQSINEVEEERDSLASENSHYQTLRITDEYKFIRFLLTLSMMRILRYINSEEVQQQISSLRAESKDEIIVQLHVSLNLYAQLKEDYDIISNQLLEAKLQSESIIREQRRSISSAKNNLCEVKNIHESIDIPTFNDENIIVADQVHVQYGQRKFNVPAKFTADKYKTRVPDGTGGSKRMMNISHGRSFIF